MMTLEHTSASIQLARLMEFHQAETRADLCAKLGVSKNMVRNWEIAGEVPDRYLQCIRRPLQLVAALAVLRDPQLGDAEARKAALSFLQQLEAAHG